MIVSTESDYVSTAVQGSAKSGIPGSHDVAQHSCGSIALQRASPGAGLALRAVIEHPPHSAFSSSRITPSWTCLSRRSRIGRRTSQSPSIGIAKIGGIFFSPSEKQYLNLREEGMSQSGRTFLGHWSFVCICIINS